MRVSSLFAFGLVAVSLPAFAAGDLVAAAAPDIDRVNHDWGTAMVHGDSLEVASAYAEDAVFCDVAGNCTRGHAAILKMTQERLSKGLPKAAAARSERRMAADGFVYEWGGAELTASDGAVHAAHYLTVWQRQPGGHWLIYRNLVLP